MANVKAANNNEITTKVVEKIRERDAQRIQEEKAFNDETSRVCEIVSKGKKKIESPKLYDEAAMVELIARVPVPVATAFVQQDQGHRKFSEDFPCLFNFALGLVAGIVIATAIAALIFIRGVL